MHNPVSEVSPFPRREWGWGLSSMSEEWGGAADLPELGGTVA